MTVFPFDRHAEYEDSIGRIWDPIKFLCLMLMFIHRAVSAVLTLYLDRKFSP